MSYIYENFSIKVSVSGYRRSFCISPDHCHIFFMHNIIVLVYNIIFNTPNCRTCCKFTGIIITMPHEGELADADGEGLGGATGVDAGKFNRDEIRGVSFEKHVHNQLTVISLIA